MSFREIDKEPTPGTVPVRLADLIRHRHVAERRSLAEVTTELLCVALEIDPREFGIIPRSRPRAKARRREPATASA